MQQPEERTIRLRSTPLNHQWAMEMMQERQVHHRDGMTWAVVEVSTRQKGLFIRIREIYIVTITVKPGAKTMTTEIEKTKRQMYADIKRFESMVGSTRLFKTFQDSLEAHLEELRKAMVRINESTVACAHHSAESFLDLETRLSAMTEERDQIQQRLHAIDHAYCEQSNRAGAQAREIERLNELNRIAGEELIRVQGIARQYLDELAAVRTQHGILSDAYEHQKQLTRSACVAERESWVQIRELTGLVTSQRQAIADMHMAGRSAKSAVATLQRLGYTDCGGQLWKPPIGKRPDFVDYGAELRKQNNGKPSR